MMNLEDFAARSKRVLVLSMVGGALVSSACKAAAPDPNTKFETIQIPLKDKGKLFTLEVADTEARRELGLMNRKSMPADHGMLFIFDKTDKWAFWMKNTLIALDLVFLDEEGKVVGIFALKPEDETNVGPDKPARFAIELNAGTAKAIDLKVGDTVPLPEKVLKAVHPQGDK